MLSTPSLSMVLVSLQESLHFSKSITLYSETYQLCLAKIELKLEEMPSIMLITVGPDLDIR